MTAEAARAGIVDRLRDELLQSQSSEVAAVARDLATHYGPTVAAVLFYGSCLRQGTTDGLLDFYVLVDDYRAASMSVVGAVAARLLPPAVYYHATHVGPHFLRVKVAVMTCDQFRQRMRPDSLDTTLWARFCQPAALVYARDSSAVEAAVAALAEAVITAGCWAARLGPDAGAPEDYWRALFQATYAAELRVERESRGVQIYDASATRYDALLADAWRALGWTGIEGKCGNPLPVAFRRRHHRAWDRRRWMGKLLNILRLAKAAFTFRGGADYIVWKIERHSGYRIQLTEFQRRHPLLAAPSVLWLLIRRGLVR